MKTRYVRSLGVDQFVIQVPLLSFSNWSKRRVSSWILPHKWHPSLVTLHFPFHFISYVYDFHINTLLDVSTFCESISRQVN